MAKNCSLCGCVIHSDERTTTIQVGSRYLICPKCKRYFDLKDGSISIEDKTKQLKQWSSEQANEPFLKKFIDSTLNKLGSMPETQVENENPVEIPSMDTEPEKKQKTGSSLKLGQIVLLVFVLILVIWAVSVAISKKAEHDNEVVVVGHTAATATSSCSHNYVNNICTKCGKENYPSLNLTSSEKRIAGKIEYMGSVSAQYSNGEFKFFFSLFDDKDKAQTIPVLVKLDIMDNDDNTIWKGIVKSDEYGSLSAFGNVTKGNLIEMKLDIPNPLLIAGKVKYTVFIPDYWKFPENEAMIVNI